MAFLSITSSQIFDHLPVCLKSVYTISASNGRGNTYTLHVNVENLITTSNHGQNGSYSTSTLPLDNAWNVNKTDTSRGFAELWSETLSDEHPYHKGERSPSFVGRVCLSDWCTIDFELWIEQKKMSDGNDRFD